MQDAMAEWTRNIFKDISGDGGCIMLNFGCELVPQNVLNDMLRV